MLDPIALLQSLTLPSGAISGRRIVLDGNTGIISIYDASDNLIAQINPVQDAPASLTGDGIFKAFEPGGTATARLRISETGKPSLALYSGDITLHSVHEFALYSLDSTGAPDHKLIGQLQGPAIDSRDRAVLDLNAENLAGVKPTADFYNPASIGSNFTLKSRGDFVADGNVNALTDSRVNGKSLPCGVMDVQDNAGGFGPASAETTIATAAAVAFDGVQRARIILHIGLWNASILNDTFDFRVKEGATTLQTVRKRVLVAGANQDGATIVYTTPTPPSAGNHTYSATFLRVAGTGTLTIPAAGTAPVQLTVEPVGSG